MNKAFIPVMLTPFKTGGEVDYDMLTQLTEYYLNAGAKGLFSNCLSSEMFELSEEERLRVVRHVVKVANGAVPVVATGTFHPEVSKQAEFIRKIHDTGTQAVIVITGLMAAAGEDDEILERNVSDLISLTAGIPLGFYECPRPYKRLLSADQLQRFVATGRVLYHKDTSLDISQVKAKITACEGYTFGLYDAYMVNAIESLKAGAAGLSCIQGNYFPKLIVWLCENFDNPEFAMELQKVNAFLVENMDIMHDVYPFSAKYCLQKQGLPISTVVRTPGKSFSPAVQGKIDLLLSNYRHLVRDLPFEVVV